MKKCCLFFAVLFAVSSSIAGQTKTNETIARQIQTLKAGKHIELIFDGGTSRIKAVAENFSSKEADKAGIYAINFAVGFFYVGQSLAAEPNSLQFSFWVMSNRPAFTEASRLLIFAGGETIDLGTSRYAAKPRSRMEYLNFELTRASLAKIAAQSNTRLRLGNHEFTFTREHLNLIANVLLISSKDAH
ncbi:MAG: hypothetical protein LC734_05835 [Acidobacteria bacterium]|nr:hypothetical protein [Acidobacteriota bacterium]